MTALVSLPSPPLVLHSPSPRRPSVLAVLCWIYGLCAGPGTLAGLALYLIVPGGA